MPSIGLAFADYSQNDNGQVITIGSLEDIDTQVTNDFQEGDVVYVASGGGLTNVKPTGTNLIQNVGKVGRRQQNNGEIVVMAIGRSNDVPNIPDGQAWIGNASGVATPTTLATVATSGAYSDLSGTPTIPAAPAVEDNSGTPALATGITQAEMQSVLGVDASGTDNSTDVTLATVGSNYLSISGQEITSGTVPLVLGGTGATSAASARTNLGVDAAGTDNSTDLTLTTVASNYLTLSGQELTAGTVPLVLGGTGATTAAAARTNLGVDASGTDNSTDVTLATVASNYLTLSGQEITAGTVPLVLGGTGATTASAARTNLGVDAAGTDNSTDVTLATVGSNYLSLSGQEITAGTVPVVLGGTGATTASAARTNLGVDAAGTDNSTDVTLAGSLDYLTLSGQEITLNQVDYNTDISNTPTIPSGDVVDDTTPQLGGDLDVNGNDITSASNGDIVIDPDGTGAIILRSDDIRFDGTGGVTTGQIKLYETSLLSPQHFIALEAPLSVTADTTFILPDGDGTSGQALKTNGSGQLGFIDVLDGLNDTLFGVTNIKKTGGTDGQLAFYDDAGDNFVVLRAPDILNANTTYKLPTADGSDGQYLTTDGSGNLKFAGGGTRIKILPKDFVADDVGRPVMINDTNIGSNSVHLKTFGSASAYVCVDIPVGYKATHAMIHGSDTAQNYKVYEASIDSATITSKSSSTAIGTEADITDVTGSSTNYLFILVESDGESDEFYGGYVTVTTA